MRRLSLVSCSSFPIKHHPSPSVFYLIQYRQLKMLLLRILTLGLLAHHGAAAPTEGQATDLSDHHHLQSRSPDEPAHIPQDTAELVPNSWIIHLKDNAEKSPAEHAAWATKIHEEYPQGLKGVHLIMNWHNTKTYGYAGDFADKTIDKIRKDKDVYHSSILTGYSR